MASSSYVSYVHVFVSHYCVTDINTEINNWCYSVASVNCEGTVNNLLTHVTDGTRSKSSLPRMTKFTLTAFTAVTLLRLFRYLVRLG